MNLISAQRNAAYLASLAALAASLVSGELPLPVTIAAGAGFILSYFVGERTAERGAWLWRVGLVGGLLFLTANVLVGTYDIILASTIFALLILMYALFNRGTTKDYARVHLAALLCISGGAALSSELAFGTSFLVFAVATTWSLTLTQLRLEIEDEAKANQVADGGASILNSRRFATPRFLGTLAGLALASLGVAVLIFMAFPRVSFGILQRQASSGNRTGFTNEVNLGGTGRIKDDPTVAFRVTVKRSSVGGESLGLYWRGATLDTYDGRSWKDASPPARPIGGRRESVYFLERLLTPTDEFMVELPGDVTAETIFITGQPTELRLQPRPAGLRSLEPPRLLRDAAGDITYRPPQSQPFRYELFTYAPKERNLRGLGRDYEPQLGAHFTALPELDPRILELSRKLTDGKDPYDAAVAVERYLSGYQYTTDMRTEGDDPLSSFLFTVKAGHCEYFATAMAVLLRAGGVPARVVTGYYGGRFVESGNYYAIREGDAHAWTEVFFSNEGWVTFDATPASSREATDSMLSRLELWMDGLRTVWRTSIVDYNLGDQIRGLQSLGELSRGLTSRLTGGSKTKRFDASAVRRVLVPAAVILVVAAGAYVLWRRRSRTERKFEPRSESQRRARLLYFDLLRRLERQGVPTKPSQTPREVAASARARQHPNAPVVDRIVERYLASRYGTAVMEADEYKALRRELKQL